MENVLSFEWIIKKVIIMEEIEHKKNMGIF